ncbi:MAG: hypothetical protein JXR51_08155 [Bacteroidales bacterium]|nr:hypothetical protein [Bacteroidales bacterium]MBN2757133.1 hypothetical protein [Bacteroidales bacterium]
MVKVKHENLILIAAFIWLIAASILLLRAYSWISLLSENQLIISLIISLPLGLLKTYFIFHKLTIKNIVRIESLSDSVSSIFNFHTLKDKILIIVMILTGSLLRQSPIIPKYVLMPIYIGIGISMLYVTCLYFKVYFTKRLSGLKKII